MPRVAVYSDPNRSCHPAIQSAQAARDADSDEFGGRTCVCALVRIGRVGDSHPRTRGTRIPERARAVFVCVYGIYGGTCVG